MEKFPARVPDRNRVALDIVRVMLDGTAHIVDGKTRQVTVTTVDKAASLLELKRLVREIENGAEEVH